MKVCCVACGVDFTELQKALTKSMENCPYCTLELTRLLDEPERPAVLPDFFEPLSGWRVWTCESNPNTLLLRAHGVYVIWHPKKAPRCLCSGKTSCEHGTRWYNDEAAKDKLPPTLHHTCGWHSYKRAQDAMKHGGGFVSDGYRQPHLILGRVAIWGKIAEHDIGYRSEYALPKHLVFDKGYAHGPEQAKRMAVEYGCTFEIVDIRKIYDDAQQAKEAAVMNDPRLVQKLAEAEANAAKQQAEAALAAQQWAEREKLRTQQRTLKNLLRGRPGRRNR